MWICEATIMKKKLKLHGEDCRTFIRCQYSRNGLRSGRERKVEFESPKFKLFDAEIFDTFFSNV